MQSLLLLALSGWLAASTASSPAPAQKKARMPGTTRTDTAAHVSVRVALSRDTVAAGSRTDVVFRFSPRKGYRVNAVPAMSVALDSTPAAALAGLPAIKGDTADGYLAPDAPVHQTVRFSNALRPGRLDLRGTLTYYYCSIEEGWCIPEKLRFSLPATVR